MTLFSYDYWVDMDGEEFLSDPDAEEVTKYTILVKHDHPGKEVAWRHLESDVILKEELITRLNKDPQLFTKFRVKDVRN